MYGEFETSQASDIQINNVLHNLLMAQRCAHVHHWRVKSLSLHLALGELYTSLTEFSDELAEIYMGLTDRDVNPEQSAPNHFSQEDPIEFIQQLQNVLQELYGTVTAYSPLLNKYEELMAKVATIKYKMTNLK